MKTIKSIMGISGILLLMILGYSCKKPQEEPEPIPFTNLSGPYFGQTPPGRTLQPFAQSVIGNWYHAEVNVSPDGNEIYWVTSSGIMFAKQIDNRWTTPRLVSFNGQNSVFRYDDVPVVSPDNSKLFFLSKRSISYNSPNEENIWYVDRTSSGWSEPKPLPQTVNSVPGIHWQISVSNNGTMYYSAGDKIYYSRYMNGNYTTPEQLSAINAFGNILCPFISPDESYIIFCKIINSVGVLYISFKSANGQWQTPQLINIKNEATSFVSRDGKYLFSGHHWISAEIIEDLRPKSQKLRYN